MKVKDTLNKAKKPILTFCIFLLVAYLIMLGLIFVSGMSRRYRFRDDEPMQFKVVLYLPDGDTEVHRVKDLRITHFGDVVNFIDEDGQRVTFNGDYKIETEKLPIREVEDN